MHAQTDGDKLGKKSASYQAAKIEVLGVRTCRRFWHILHNESIYSSSKLSDTIISFTFQICKRICLHLEKICLFHILAKTENQKYLLILLISKKVNVVILKMLNCSFKLTLNLLNFWLLMDKLEELLFASHISHVWKPFLSISVVDKIVSSMHTHGSFSCSVRKCH